MAGTLIIVLMGLLHTQTDAAEVRTAINTNTESPRWPYDTTEPPTEPDWPWGTPATPDWPWGTPTEPDWPRETTTEPDWPWATPTEPDWPRATTAEPDWPWATTAELPDSTTQDKPTPPLPIVSEWPRNMTVKFGSYVRIPFTFGTENRSTPFTAAAIEAVFTGTSELRSIFWAKEGSSGIYAEFQDDFEAIPGRKHDLRINHMTLNLAGEYLARVLSQDLEEEKRQFKVTTTLGEPSCRDSAYPRHVSEGDSVDLDCRLYYSGPSVPTLKWVDCHGNEMSGRYIDDGQNVGTVHHRQYRYSFIAEHKHAHCAFTCHVSFADDTTYTDECTTSVQVLSSSPRCNAKHQDTAFGGLLLLDCSSEYVGDTYPRRDWYHSGHWLRGDYVLDETVLPGDKERPAVHRSSYVSTVWDKLSSGWSEYECVAYDRITGHCNNCSLISHIVRKCHSQSFSEELCPSPSVIEIYGARDYVSGDCGDVTCCPRPDQDCSSSVSEADPARFSLIKAACNGNHHCESLSLHPTRIDKCDSLSDYAELYYFCVDPPYG